MSSTIINSDQNSKNRLLIAAVISNALEYINFITFIFLTPIIAKLFFPKQIHSLAITFTHLTIVIAYLFRPLGGIILGSIGDRLGRKSIFNLTLLFMAIPSFIIGILPTFNQIGYIAPVIMILMRIVQGCSIGGGEVPGSITYVFEKFRHKNYFFYCALLTCGANIGIATANQMISLLNEYTLYSFMHNIGWRILFVSDGFLAMIGFYILTFATESEEFINLKLSKQISNAPILMLIKKFRPEIINGILLCMVVSLTTSVFQIFLPGLLVTHYSSGLLVNYYSFSFSAASTMSSFGVMIMAVFSLIFAYLTKYIYPMRIVNIAEIGLILLYIIILIFGGNLTGEGKNLYHVYGVILVNSILLAGINGVFFGLLADLFPANVRYSGISVCYNIAYILGAGLTPLWTNSLLIISDKSYKYVIAVCLIFLLLFISIFKPKIVVSSN